MSCSSKNASTCWPVKTLMHSFFPVSVSVRVMENEEGRKEYLVFPPSKNQCPAGSQKGRKIPLKGNGRRIDYILYSNEGLQQEWKLVCFSRELRKVRQNLTFENSGCSSSLKLYDKWNSFDFCPPLLANCRCAFCLWPFQPWHLTFMYLNN